MPGCGMHSRPKLAEKLGITAYSKYSRQQKRGGLGGYSPPSEHASPPSEGERDFSEILAFIVP